MIDRLNVGNVKGVALFLLAIAAASLGAQQAAPSITVSGAVSQSLTLTAADLVTMPRATVTTSSNGIETKYEGVWLAEVLKKAGVPLGAALRGPALSTYVVASASDGYQVVFSLGELDPDMTDGQFLLADKANGKPLIGQNGAFPPRHPERQARCPVDSHGDVVHCCAIAEIASVSKQTATGSRGLATSAAGRDREQPGCH